MEDIETYPGFCTKCGSILPPMSMDEFVKCYSCRTVFGPESKQTQCYYFYYQIAVFTIYHINEFKFDPLYNFK